MNVIQGSPLPEEEPEQGRSYSRRAGASDPSTPADSAYGPGNDGPGNDGSGGYGSGAYWPGGYGTGGYGTGGYGTGARAVPPGSRRAWRPAWAAPEPAAAARPPSARRRPAPAPCSAPLRS